MSQSQSVRDAAGASRIFVFDEVFSQRAAQEQAEKKKLGAFGMMAKFNPLNRPRDDTVQLAQQELRYEPFWHLQAQRSVDYSCQLTYQIPVHNPHAQSVEIEGRSFTASRQKDRARIEVVVTERCHRKMQFERMIDGMRRDIKPAAMEACIRKYKFTELERLDLPRLVTPLVSMVAAKQQAMAELNHEAVNASEIENDRIEFERTHLYVRPVFAFEFRWTSADRMGVIEVDGLSGEVVEGGSWFTDKVNRVITRDMLVELGAEVAGAFIPGGRAAVKMIDRIAGPDA